jgi:hypothetical protein
MSATAAVKITVYKDFDDAQADRPLKTVREANGSIVAPSTFREQEVEHASIVDSMKKTYDRASDSTKDWIADFNSRHGL